MNQVFLEQLGLWGPKIVERFGDGKTIWCDPSRGSSSGSAGSPHEAISTLPGAYAKMATGRNDVLKLIASATAAGVNSAASLASAFTWALNCSHLMGEGSFGRWNQRSRIGHSANFGTLFTVSGFGNSFQDVYFAHGRGSATNLLALDITGARNSFLRTCVGGPFHATEAGTAGYSLVKLENSETFFKDCTFGQDSIARTAANTMITFGAQADPPRARFENCTFLSIVSAAGGAGSTFLKVVSGAGAGLAEFINCRFLNIGGTAMTLGIDGAGLGNFKMFFDHCTFAGCTDVVAAAYEGYCFFNACTYTSGAGYNGLAATYVHTP